MPGLIVGAFGERRARDLLDQLLVARAVGQLRRHVGGQGVTGLLAGQRLLQAGHDVAGAMQIAQWRIGRGLVDDDAIVVGQGVMNGGDAAVHDLHGKPPLKVDSEGYAGSFTARIAIAVLP